MSFDRLPDELLACILSHVSSVDLATNIQRVNRRFNRISSDPKLWHYHCSKDFLFWNESARAQLNQAVRQRSYGHPWKDMWLNRMRGDYVCTRHFEHVIASKVNRMRHLRIICSRQLDSKDFLLRHYRWADRQAFLELEAGERGMPPPEAPLNDCLARRYYAQMALGSINRSLAVEEWVRVRSQSVQFDRLDRAVAAFDNFSLLGDGADMDRVVDILDQLSRAFQHDHRSTLEGLTVRQKSHALLRWLRSHNLLGMSNAEYRYRDVRNCLMGQALTNHPNHPSLPLISSAIFASIGRRIGLQAYCVAIPGHVHVTVLSPPGTTVDDTRVKSATHDQWKDPKRRRPKTLTHQLRDNGERMFLDPYQDVGELNMQQMRHSMDEISEVMDVPLLHAGTAAEGGSVSGDVEMLNDAADGETETAEDGEPGGGGATVAPHEPPRRQLHRDSYLLPAPTFGIVLRLALNIDVAYDYAARMSPERARTAMQLYRAVPADIPHDHETLQKRRRCGSEGDAYSDMERMTYASAWASLLMRSTTSADWEEHLDRLLRRFTHEFNEDAWILDKYLLPIHDKYMRDAVAADPQGRHATGRAVPMPFLDPGARMRANAWTHVRNLLKLVSNLDSRQPLVSRRYTQEICERVVYKVGQVMRHRRFQFIAIIDGWTPADPNELPGPRTTVSRDEMAPAPGPGSAGSAGTARALKTPYYSCLRSGGERRVVAQHNIEIVTDPALIPPELMFLAGKHFKRFDYATCTFVSNLGEFFPDD